MTDTMNDKINVRVKFQTPLGTYCVPGDEIDATEKAYKDYVEEVTALFLDTKAKNGVASFTDDDGDVIFLMPECLKNSIMIVERF